LFFCYVEFFLFPLGTATGIHVPLPEQTRMRAVPHSFVLRCLLDFPLFFPPPPLILSQSIPLRPHIVAWQEPRASTTNYKVPSVPIRAIFCPPVKKAVSHCHPPFFWFSLLFNVDIDQPCTFWSTGRSSYATFIAKPRFPFSLLQDRICLIPATGCLSEARQNVCRSPRIAHVY